jgi:hypothetical protein
VKWQVSGIGIELGDRDECQRCASGMMPLVSASPFLFRFEGKMYCRAFGDIAQLARFVLGNFGKDVFLSPGGIC